MNEEIKKSINRIQGIVDFYKLDDENNYDYSDKDLISMKTLLNYITNLQEENKKLKELCDKYEEEHNSAFKLWTTKMEEMPDYEERMKLKQENQKLKKTIKEAKEKSIKLQEKYDYILDDLTFILARGIDYER